MNYLDEFYSSFSIPFRFENGTIEWFPQSDEVAPDKSVVSQKLSEYKTEKAWSDFRRKRDQLLSATDWWCVSDRTATAEQLAYRQALRDLPANSSPALDEDGNLTGVTWPEKPSS